MSLVEVVIALVLFGFVGLAAGALLESAARSAREAEARERLLWMASTALDSLRAVATWSPGERTLPTGDVVRWIPGDEGGVVELLLTGRDRPWLAVPVGLGAGSVTDPRSER